MECDRCHANIEPEEEKNHLGETLCEDCYMDALSMVKTCDPWAVHSAKSFEKHAEGAPILTVIQSEILSILKETGGIEPQALVKELGGKVTQKELEREFAALRHMEKARGEKRGHRVVWRAWQGKRVEQKGPFWCLMLLLSLKRRSAVTLALPRQRQSHPFHTVHSSEDVLRTQ